MFICINFGNKTFFDSEIEVTKSISLMVGILKIDNRRFEDYDITEEYLCSNLHDVINGLNQIRAAELYFDPQLNRYFSNYLSCACLSLP